MVVEGTEPNSYRHRSHNPCLPIGMAYEQFESRSPGLENQSRITSGSDGYVEKAVRVILLRNTESGALTNDKYYLLHTNFHASICLKTC